LFNTKSRKQVWVPSSQFRSFAVSQFRSYAVRPARTKTNKMEIAPGPSGPEAQKYRFLKTEEFTIEDLELFARSNMTTIDCLVGVLLTFVGTCLVV